MVDAALPDHRPAGECPGREGLDPLAEPTLVAAGWVARFLTDGGRAEEAMRIYADLGFEVRTQPLAPDHVGPLCAECQVTACSLYAMIYTRRRPVDIEDASHVRDG